MADWKEDNLFESFEESLQKMGGRWQNPGNRHWLHRILSERVP